MSEVTKSHSLSIGIVGLPNAGKSTLFNSLTKNQVPAENYPFCTIDKNVGVVEVPDERLDALESHFKAKKRVSSIIKFVDIAGLVKGASEGEGLGNQFLSHIREVDVILYVLRAFKSETISHVYERVNPVEDFQIVQQELILKDLETMDKKVKEMQKKARATSDKELLMQLDVTERAFAWLNEGKPVIEMEMTEEESAFIHEMWLLSNKKRMFALNVREGLDVEDVQVMVQNLKDAIPDEDHDFIMILDVKMIGEISGMSENDKKEYLELLETEPVLEDTVITNAFTRLGLITFYTGSEEEVNAWAIGNGATIKASAGVIHSDLADGFITADVINVDTLVEAGGMVDAKENGLVKNQGKTYVTQDGDYVIVYHN